MKKILFAALLFFLAPVLVLPQSEALVRGRVISQANGRPIPGLTVSLIHPSLGRSAPSVTNAQGEYYISGIPLMQEAFYIEIYWGSELVYRASLRIDRERVTMEDIFL